KDLCALYCGIIRTFASFAMKCDSKKDTDLSLAALGLRAIQAVAESRATYAADCFYELPCVIKAIVTSIAQTYTPGESVSVAIAEDRLGTIDEMSDLSAVPNSAVLCRWAWLCLGTLVRGSHGQHSHVIVAEIFKRLDQGLQWQPAPLCVQIVTDVIGNLQSQDRNMVIVEILGLLTNGMHASNLYAGGTLNNSTSSFKGLGSAVLRQTDGPPETQAADSSKEANMRTCISRILERLFCQPHVLVGISVMDVLNVLVTFLIESVAGKRIVVPDSSVFSAVLKAMLAGNEFDIGREFETSNVPSDYYYLLAAIGGLARHHYYSNQVADMIEYLVQRMQLKWSGSSERDVQNRHSIRQHWLVQVLYIVLVNCKAAQESPTSAFMLPFRTFAPVFTLMSHENQALRIQAADCVILILQHNHANGANQESNDSWQPEVVEAVYRKLGGLLRQEHQSDASLASTAGYAAIAGVLYGLLCAQRSHAIKHTLVLVDSCAPINMNEAWITTLGMICKQAARLSTNDSAAEANVSATIEKARNSGVWSSEIEDVCMNRLPAISLYINSTDEKAAKEAASASVNNVANTDGGDIAFFQKALGPASIMDMFGADVAAQYEELRSKQGSIGEGYWESDSESIDRMLCNPGEDSAPAREMQNSVSQVNDIRARVSVDWETQMRRDSILAPHVNIDQLRMALHDGLSVHSSEHLASISVNENRARIVPRSNISESSVYYPYG
ncbi:plasma membrane localization protein, partial [Coemansia sp. BCRC 34490]